MRLFSRSMPFLAAATPAGGGSLPSAPLQRTSVVNGNYADAVATFPSPVTAGSVLVIFGGGLVDDAVVTSDQAGTVVLNQFDLWAGQRVILGYITGAGAGTTTLTMSGTERKSFYAEEWAGIVLDSAGVGATTPATFGAVTATTPSTTSVADTISFTSWSVRTGETIPTSVVASGFTEGGRYEGPNTSAVFIGGYRIDSSAGAKSAVWANCPDDPGAGQGALIACFRAA